MQFSSLQVPSGQVYDTDDLALLRMMAECKFIEWREQEFTLKSGIKSHVYVFGREDLTDNPEFECKVGLKIVRLMAENALSTDKQICFIGLPTAGTAMAQAAATAGFYHHIKVCGKYMCHRIMREIVKGGHGAKEHQQNWVNGKPDQSRHTYGDVDNVVTDAGTKFEARERFIASGYPVDDMFSFIFVDRQQGGVQRMEKAGFKRIIVAYKLKDLTYAFGEMGLWPKEAVKQVEDEIAAHQFK